MTSGHSIVALSSGRLPAGIGVVRISGPATRFVVETIIGHLPRARHAEFGALLGADGGVLDHALTIFFEGPASFTGEDVAEFHLHGGRAVVAAVLERLASFPGVRHAEPGEFTRRAFLNGKRSLLETEALADLLQAETEAQRRFAVHNSEGGQAVLYESWRKRLINARALLEAELDFADEGDVPGSVSDRVWQDVAAMVAEIGVHQQGFRRAEIVRDGFDVAIVGAPNAGKSSLLNALVRREAAIVTDEPGTTRDLIEVVMDIDGVKVRLTDTAGLREATGNVEAIGIQRTMERARQASLVVFVEDLMAPGVAVLELSGPMLRVGSKADLVAERESHQGYDLVISTRTGEGVDRLLKEIGRRAALAVGDLGDVLPSRVRHMELLEQTGFHLAAALGGSELALELRAEELRSAASSLGRITGAVDVEDLLDVIFSEFCIGK